MDQEPRKTDAMDRTDDPIRRRITRNRGYLKAGVVGALAIRYLRQIAEDTDALTESDSPDQSALH